MFLKQEKPEMDNLEEKNLVLKEKYLDKFQYFKKIVFNGNPCKNVTKYFCIGHSKHFFLF